MAYLVNAFSYPLYFLHGSIFGQGNLTYRALTRQALVWRALVRWALVWRALVWRALVWQALVPRALVLNFKTKIPSRTPILFRFLQEMIISLKNQQCILYFQCLFVISPWFCMFQQDFMSNIHLLWFEYPTILEDMTRNQICYQKSFKWDQLEHFFSIFLLFTKEAWLL